MAIDVNVVVLEQPYGNPGSFGEPLGIYSGAADLAGDATGGTIQLAFVPRNPFTTAGLPDARREFVYFTDGVSLRILDSIGPGSIRAEYRTHWARANAAIGNNSRHIISSTPINIDGEWTSRDPLYHDYIARFPQFWSSDNLGGQDIDLVFFRIEINENGATYELRCWGRYYDKQILANRAFGRLIQPPAITQFPL